MTASNLAIVFAPTLMKTSQENLGMDAVGETKHHARVIELLIAYVNYIFGPVELHMPQTSSMRNNDHHSVRGPHARSQRSSARNKGKCCCNFTEFFGKICKLFRDSCFAIIFMIFFFFLKVVEVEAQEITAI